MTADSECYTLIEQVDRLTVKDEGLTQEVGIKIEDNNTHQRYVVTIDKNGPKEIYSCRTNTEVNTSELTQKNSNFVKLYRSFIHSMINFSDSKYYSHLLDAKNARIIELRKKFESSKKAIEWLSTELKSTSNDAMLSRADIENLLIKEKDKYRRCEQSLTKELFLFDTLIKSNPKHEKY